MLTDQQFTRNFSLSINKIVNFYYSLKVELTTRYILSPDGIKNQSLYWLFKRRATALSHSFIRRQNIDANATPAEIWIS